VLCSGVIRPDHIDGWAGDGKLFWESGFDTIDSRTDAEPVSGGVSNDLIYGVRRHDGLYGDGRSDRVDGGAGDASLIGGWGNCMLFGNVVRDLSGGPGKLLDEFSTTHAPVDIVAGETLCSADGRSIDLVDGAIQEESNATLLF
jgi:Ca2+-binding RTX toxin-like protein